MEPGYPGLSLGTQAVVRASYGVLLLLTLLQALPQSRRFFLSDRFGGYAKSDRLVDLIQNPRVRPWLLALWLTSATLLIAGRFAVAAGLVNLLLCRYFFIQMRWKGVLRGMGAPGFMTYWLAACVFFLEYGVACDPTGQVRRAALLAFRIDFAMIMLCAGSYKALAGYPSNHGMELGMINPWWGYWGRFYARLAPGHWLFRVLNQLAYLTEITAGLLMLLPQPQLQFLGALLISASFAFIATQIRLGFLAEMCMLCGLLFVPQGGNVDRALQGLVPAAAPPSAPMPGWFNAALAAALLGYVALLPLAKAGQYYNFLARRRLPAPLQALLDRYNNFFGIIIWRVFSADHTNFFTRVFLEDPSTGARAAYAQPGFFDRKTGFRFGHVGEFICLASLFTTLKYYPSNNGLFVERIVRYARTIPVPRGSHLVFQYVSLRKTERRFEEATIAEYYVDPEAGSVREVVLDSSLSVRARIAASPIYEAQRPGSYAPAAPASR